MTVLGCRLDLVPIIKYALGWTTFDLVVIWACKLDLMLVGAKIQSIFNNGLVAKLVNAAVLEAVS